MEEEVRTILKDVFGDSSESEESRGDEAEDPIIRSVFGGTPNWERISPINGLWLCTDFLSPHQQSSLLAEIHKEGWFSEASGNQAMRFGDLPEWATELSNSVREAVFFSDCLSESTNAAKGGKACLFPSELLWREPLFDQLIVNTYLPGEGICAHVDLMRFQDGIAIVSLESACVMHFSRVEDELSDDNRTAEDPGDSTSTAKIPVLLSEGSLVLMWGEARYLWKHEINRKPGFQKWKGQDIIDQRKRTSITLRKLC